MLRQYGFKFAATKQNKLCWIGWGALEVDVTQWNLVEADISHLIYTGALQVALTDLGTCLHQNREVLSATIDRVRELLIDVRSKEADFAEDKVAKEPVPLLQQLATTLGKAQALQEQAQKAGEIQRTVGNKFGDTKTPSTKFKTVDRLFNMDANAKRGQSSYFSGQRVHVHPHTAQPTRGARALAIADVQDAAGKGPAAPVGDAVPGHAPPGLSLIHI